MPQLAKKSSLRFLVVETLSPSSGGCIGRVPLLVHEAGEETAA